MTAQTAAGEIILHASCVAFEDRGLLILGPSGCGKSSLALTLIGLGARLVADDRTILQRRGDGVMARCPDALRGMIEARGIGLLHADAVTEVQVRLVVDLEQIEAERLPPKRQVTLLQVSLDLVLGQDAAHFPFALLQALRGGRRA
ncbi:MAG: HPr kinase/phosphatase C-terminal domain-containing protein [Paracoccaceae bacterium]